MNLDYDVIVVGAGPAGSTAARFCAQSGLKTLLIEKEKLPRYKPCGGCLSLKTIRLLPFDLSPVLENSIYKAKFTYLLKNTFFISSEKPFAFMVMRDRFDQFLIEKALEKGANLFEEERVTCVAERDGGVEVELTKGKKIRCEYLIGADGSESTIARSLFSSQLMGDSDGIGLDWKARFLMI